jgi:uncharacterized membrane protein
MRIQESIEIDAPRERVWEAVSDFKTASAFLQGIEFSTMEDEKSSGDRARWKIRVRAGSAMVGGVVEVIEWDPPHELAWTSITGIDQRGRWILHEKGNGTEAILRLGYQVPGGVMALIADRIGSRPVRRNVRESLGALKRLLEVKYHAN